MFAAYTLELGNHVAHGDAGAQTEGYQSTYGFGLCGDGTPGFSDGGENFEGFAVQFVDGKVQHAESRLDFLSEAHDDIGALAYTTCGLSVVLVFRRRGTGCEYLHGFAAVAVDGDALATEFKGQAIDAFDIFDACAVGEVDGFGDGVVRVFLESGTNMIFKISAEN